ncbi:MAG: Heme-binding protein A [Anaerolineales bacterium]|nr:Heme-binding protein A [Anaerolineales bacterium]
MEDQERMHPYIPELADKLRKGEVSRREFLRLATLTGMSYGAAQFMAACGGAAPSGAPAEEAPAEEAPAEEAPAVAGPKRGGTIRGSMQVIRIDHPARYSWVYDANVTRHVCEYLTLTDGNNITHPYLLEKWEASDDLLTWDLHLRKNVTWNNGDPFTADDVIFTMNEWLNPEVGSSILGLMSYLQPTGIEKVDDHLVRLNLDVAEIAVPEHLFHYPAQVLNHRTFEGDIVAQPVGTGPFTLEEYSVGERAVLKRRDDYWQMGEDGKPLPYLDEIIYIDQGEDQTAAVTAIKAGQIDHIFDVAPPTWEALKDFEDVEVHSIGTARTRVLRMRVDKEPWTDPRVRKALRLCQKRQRILDLAFFGEGLIGQDHHVAPGVHPEYAEVPTPEYDPEQAKALLDEAGYPDGLDVELAIGTGWPDVVSYGETLKEDAAAGGFNITLNTMPNSQYWDLWTEVDLGITPWTHRPLGTMVLNLAYICDAEGEPVPWNETRWCDDEFTELLVQANGTLDVDERREIMKKLEEIQMERGSIGIAYFFTTWIIMNKKFKNVHPHPTVYDLWNDLWYDPEA